MTKRRRRRGIGESEIRIGEPILFAAEPVEWLTAADDPDAPKRFKMTAYTGGPLRLNAYFAPTVIDLQGLKLNGESTPILVNHDPHEIAGHADQVDITAQTVKLAGVVSGGGEAAAEVVASAAKGFPWKASVGVNPSKVEFVQSGAMAKANGRNFKGPVNIVRGSMLVEVSFVPIAADPKTKVSMAASAALNSKKETDMDKFEKWLKAQGVDAEALTDEAVAELQAAHKAKFPDEEPAPPVTPPEPTPPPTPPAAPEDPAVSMRASAAAELTRQTEIATICAGDHPQIQAKAVAENWGKPETELAVLRAGRPKGPGIHASTIDCNAAVLEAAMCQTLGIKDHEKEFGDETLQAAHGLYRGRLGLQEVLLQAACDNGYNCRPGQRITPGNLRAVIAHALPADLQAAAASTLSLPEIFSNVANKELLQGFMEEDQAWREISQTKNVSDFKTVTSYRMLDDFTYEELPPDGVMKHGQVGEETFTRKAKTYAKMFALTRPDIINDDMGAFGDLRTRLGRGAARKFNDIFWAAFINNSTFFTAARGNYITGGTTTLLVDFVGLQLGIDAFDAMKSTAVPPATKGKRIGGAPVLLLVPPELDAVAQRINADVAPSQASEVNIYSGKYRPVKVTQLSDSTFTGWSATAWYLLRNPAILAPMVVSFLNGVAEPIVESAEASFDRLGVEFRGYHDFGCDQAEWLCGVKSKGSA